MAPDAPISSGLAVGRARGPSFRRIAEGSSGPLRSAMRTQGYGSLCLVVTINNQAKKNGIR